MDTELLTVSQTAQYLKLSEKTVRRMIGNGSLPASKVANRSWRIRSCDIDDYVMSSYNNVLREPEMNYGHHEPEEQTETEKAQGPRLISLFSGCGGMDLGFKKAGFDIVYANDFDADAQAVYALNLGKIDGRDILTVDEDDIPAGDILTAGFPCQPFSNAGNRKGVHDSRGMLYKECLRIIKKTMPKVIVFENVKGLLSTKYIDGRNLADVIMEDLSTMSDIGYDVVYQLVNAADYGVPQNRQRVLFVGIRKDLGIKFKFPEKQNRSNLTLRNVLDVPDDTPNNVDWPFSPQALDMIENIPEGGSWKDVPYEHLAPRFQRIRDNMKRYHSPNFYRRFSRDEICGTMTASAQPENCGIIHPTENRRFTVREVARIQTFPDDFNFITDTPRNITAMYKVIGNAVPVTLAYNIAISIMEQVFTDK
ncbi:MAG: DNA (cytosine-5-)-methyltransferase [Candidatus Gastranaerophilales bacterium]|nr:DNA (cytosine-5-)-methyltransferase [Candidatus Gastranaerophilales bacterium]